MSAIPTLQLQPRDLIVGRPDVSDPEVIKQLFTIASKICRVVVLWSSTNETGTDATDVRYDKIAPSMTCASDQEYNIRM